MFVFEKADLAGKRYVGIANGFGYRYLWKQIEIEAEAAWTRGTLKCAHMESHTHSQVEYMAINEQYPFKGSLIIQRPLTFQHQGGLPD